MINKTYQNLLKESQESFSTLLNQKLNHSWAILNFDQFLKKEENEFFDFKNWVVLEPCLGEIESLINRSRSENKSFNLISPSQGLNEFLKETIGIEANYLKLSPIRLDLPKTKKLETVLFRGADHPLGGLEAFVGTILALQKTLKRKIHVQVDLIPALADALPYNERFAKYYDLSRETINWTKYKKEILALLEIKTNSFPDLIFSPGYSYNSGYDYFLQSFAHSGGKVFLPDTLVHREIRGDFFAPQIFLNYQLGDVNSSINKLIYELLAERIAQYA